MWGTITHTALRQKFLYSLQTNKIRKINNKQSSNDLFVCNSQDQSKTMDTTRRSLLEIVKNSIVYPSNRIQITLLQEDNVPINIDIDPIIQTAILRYCGEDLIGHYITKQDEFILKKQKLLDNIESYGYSDSRLNLDEEISNRTEEILTEKQSLDSFKETVKKVFPNVRLSSASVQANKTGSGSTNRSRRNKTNDLFSIDLLAGLDWAADRLGF